MKTRTIKVTKKDIAAGIQNSPCLCPIARAVKRALKLKDGDTHPHEFGIGGHYVRIGHVKYNLPQSAAKFIARFDHAGVAKPFQFKMQLP